MTDSCRSWPTILAWLENDLPDEESQLLNVHVGDCDECRAKLALMNAVQDVGDVQPRSLYRNLRPVEARSSWGRGPSIRLELPSVPKPLIRV